MCVPVRRSCSRRKWTSRTRGSTWPLRTLPLTVIETWAIGVSFARGKRALDYSKTLTTLGLESLGVDAVVPDLVVEDPLRRIEEPCGTCAIAPGRLQRILEQVFLVGGDGVEERDARHSARRLGGLQGRRQVMAVDDLAIAHQDRSLDGVLELADVAGPVIAGQHV